MIALSRELGRKVKALDDMPELFVHLQSIWDAFHLLSSSRQMTMGGFGPIPLRDIIDYMQWQEITNMDEQLRWIKMLRGLDGIYIQRMNKVEE